MLENNFHYIDHRERKQIKKIKIHARTARQTKKMVIEIILNATQRGPLQLKCLKLHFSANIIVLILSYASKIVRVIVHLVSRITKANSLFTYNLDT